MNPTVLVLLATYNGERFLRQQIESILGQTYAELRILARDDGSQDGTAAILQEYRQLSPERFSVLPNRTPSGSAKWNFLRLIEAALAQEEWSYLAFADQDDVWLPDKVALTMTAMQGLAARHPLDTPLVVFTDLTVVDEHLSVLFPSMWAQQRIEPRNMDRFERVVADNVITGCTALINPALARLMTRMRPEASMHDWWLAALASGLGFATALGDRTVLYRQHTGNVLGAVVGSRPKGLPKWRRHEKRREYWETMQQQGAALLLEHGGELTPAKTRSLEALLLCNKHPSGMVRVFQWLRHGFRVQGGLRPNLALLWYLWDVDPARKEEL